MIPLRDDNPTRRPAVVTVAIIIACVVVFAWHFSLSENGRQAFVYSLGFIPATLFGDRELPPELHLVPAEMTLFTSLFVHGGLLHLVGNMLYLWIFGNNVEDAMGHGRFIVFYLVCGLAASMAQGLINPGMALPMIGASGAVAGILGAYLLLHPTARVLVVIPIFIFPYFVYLPAVAVLGLWFLLQFINSLGANPDEPGVAWFAHLGGFIAGMLLIPLFKGRNVPLFWQKGR
ncbi:rhomboid family intramembrane serine protease [Thiohalomonas denitrificans]|uniref:Membrane associated serine protease, rhomboid family n=1 Tax=Thiohalomonas denitrificans TaxID=415747 RepID=A0A1G5PT56_9GAMM|nr:rhomboid family intramembrane serine protease [Thiohalomonas denitrificans]SCZ52754.1 Membrane associated serine protease, rhomboid family [Thiohalomonas denitrificans]